MNEFVYILSDDYILIKQIIDYSLISSKFTLKGISSGGNPDINDILENQTTILIVDENQMNEHTIDKIKQRLAEDLFREIAVIYICKQINHEVNKLLSNFFLTKILINERGIFDILFVMEKIYNERNDIQSSRDQLISNYLHSLFIKPKVFGFTYLKAAIALRIENTQMKMNTICDKIAREYKVTSSRVDRCMRTSIDHAYRHHSDIYETLYNFEERPTCMHLITIIAEEISQVS